MSVFHPAAMVTLRLRFQDEAMGVTPPTPKTAAELVDAGGSADSSRKGALPKTIAGSSGDTATHLLSAVPRKAQISVPTPRRAGTFTVEFAWVDVPLDARFIKAAAAEIHVGIISAENHAAAMTAHGVAALRRRGKLRTTYVNGALNGNTLVMVGVVDDMKTSHGSSGSSVTITGRDLSALLLDEVVPGGVIEEIDLSQDIVTVARQLLSYHPHGGTIAPYVVGAADSAWSGGKVPSPMPEPARTRKGADGNRRKPRHRGPLDPGDLNFWDALSRYCQLCGAVAYFIGQELHIVPTHSLYEQVSGKATVFNGGGPRTLPSGEEVYIRRLRYGRELESIDFGRSLAGVRAQPVEAVSVDDTSTAPPSGRYITATWPPNGEAAGGALRSSETPGGEAGQQVLRVPVPGVRDPEQLRQIARAVYEEVMRGELEASFVTKHLYSAGGSEYDLDTLRLRPGDAVEFLVDTAGVGALPPLASSLTTLSAAPRGRAVDAIAASVGDRSVAEAIVRSWRGDGAKFQRVLHVETVSYDYSNTTGIRVSGTAKNYIEVELATKVPAVVKAKSGRSHKRKRQGPITIEFGDLVLVEAE